MEKRAEAILEEYERSLAQIILQCMSELPFDLGIMRLCDVLRGSRSKMIEEYQLDENSMYGVLSSYHEDRLHSVIDAMKEKRLINVRKLAGYGEVLFLSTKGQEYLGDRTSADLGLTDNRQTPYQERLARIRFKYPRAYEPWDEEEEMKLRIMVVDGCAVNDIAQVLQRQPSAIRSRIRKLEENKENDPGSRKSRIRSR